MTSNPNDYALPYCPVCDEHVPTHVTRTDDGFTVTIYKRPPLKGEMGWFVGPDDSLKEMARNVIAGREDIKDPGYGFGFKTWRDMPRGVDSDGDISITVVATLRAPSHATRMALAEVRAMAPTFQGGRDA